MDSDNPGTGEQWGRAAGRDLAFSGFNLSLFDVLKWGPVSTASVGIAFDGQITTGTLEELSFSAVLSNLTGGEAVWTGQTRVELFDAAGGGQRWENVNTQFVLTVTGSLILDSGTPRVDVLAVPGPFTAHLEMLAQHPAGGAFQPALDLFDSLDTDPNGVQLAQTSFSHGFFFESADSLSIEEHDANMEAETGAILGALDFLTIDALLRLADLDADTNRIETAVGQVLALLNGDLATTQDLGNLQSNLEQTIRDAISEISFANESELNLQVIHARKKGASGRSFLIMATEGGQLVGPDFSIDVVAALPNDPHNAQLMVLDILLQPFVSEVIAEGIAPGLVNVDVALPGSLSSTATFLIMARHSHDDGEEHSATVLTTVDPY